MKNVYLVYQQHSDARAIILDSIWKTLQEAKDYRDEVYGKAHFPWQIKEVMVHEENYES